MGPYSVKVELLSLYVFPCYAQELFDSFNDLFVVLFPSLKQPRALRKNYRLVLQLHFHLLDVVCLLWLVVGYVAKELVDFVIVCAVVGIGALCFLQGLRSVGEMDSMSAQSQLLSSANTSLLVPVFPSLLPKDTDLSWSCSPSASLQVLFCRNHCHLVGVKARGNRRRNESQGNGRENVEDAECWVEPAVG